MQRARTYLSNQEFLQILLNPNVSDSSGNPLISSHDITISELEILIKNCGFSEEIALKFGPNNKRKLKFENCSFESDFIIESGLFSNLVISESNGKDLKFKGGSFESVIIGDGSVFNNIEVNVIDVNQNFTISNSPQLNALREDINISNVRINSSLNALQLLRVNILNLEFVGFEVSSTESIFLNNIKIGSLSFNTIVNDGSIVIQNMLPIKSKINKIDHNVSFYDCLMGKTNLISCNFSDHNITIDSSKLTELFYTNTLFPDRINSSNNNQQLKYRQEKDTYGQLETVAKNAGNLVGAMEWRAMSNDSYLHVLKTWKFWKSQFWDFLNLQLSKTASYYGTDIRISILSTVLFSISMHSLLILIADPNVQIGIPTIEQFLSLIDNYYVSFFKFLNPIRGFNYLEIENITFYKTYLTLDYLSRLALGYLIYHLIRSTRRFTLKG